MTRIAPPAPSTAPGPATRHTASDRARRAAPSSSISTPSSRSSLACSWTRCSGCRGLMPPPAFTTRCQGTPSGSGQWRSAPPTTRAARGSTQGEGNIPIGHHPAGWNAADEPVDSFSERQAHGSWPLRRQPGGRGHLLGPARWLRWNVGGGTGEVVYGKLFVERSFRHDDPQDHVGE